MKKLHSFVFYALVTPAITLGASSVMAQQAFGEDNNRLQQSMQRDQYAMQSTTSKSSQNDQRTQQRAKQSDMQKDNERHSSRDQSRSQNRGYINAVPANGMEASKLVGTDVKTSNNEDIGSVDDLIIDDEGQVVAILVSVGGFLGMGQKDVAIGWDNVTKTGSGDNQELRVDVTRDELRSAPEFAKRDSYSSRSSTDQGSQYGQGLRQGTQQGSQQREQQGTQTAQQRSQQREQQGTQTAQQRSEQREQQGTQTAQQRSQQREQQGTQQTAQQREQQGSQQGTQQSAQERMQQSAQQRTNQSDRQSETDRRTTQGQSRGQNRGHIASVPMNGMQSSDLVGTDVRTNDNEDIGSVDDLIIDENGQVVAIVVSVGGFLGMGQKDVAIGWDDVTRTGSDNDRELRVSLSRDDLNTAPKFAKR